MKYTINDDKGNMICSIENVDPTKSTEDFGKLIPLLINLVGASALAGGIAIAANYQKRKQKRVLESKQYEKQALQKEASKQKVNFNAFKEEVKYRLSPEYTGWLMLMKKAYEIFYKEISKPLIDLANKHPYCNDKESGFTIYSKPTFEVNTTYNTINDDDDIVQDELFISNGNVVFETTFNIIQNWNKASVGSDESDDYWKKSEDLFNSKIKVFKQLIDEYKLKFNSDFYTGDNDGNFITVTFSKSINLKDIHVIEMPND